MFFIKTIYISIFNLDFVTRFHNHIFENNKCLPYYYTCDKEYLNLIEFILLQDTITCRYHFQQLTTKAYLMHYQIQPCQHVQQSQVSAEKSSSPQKIEISRSFS